MPKINNLFPALLIFALAGCTTIYNPATQRKETLLIDTREEISIGKDMDKQVRKQLPVKNDPAMQQRLENIGARVAAASDRKDLDYHFAVIDDKDFNAFAIPGGFIYVNSGLMDNATDAELAAVVAHEIGHVAARHSVKRIQAQLGYQILATIGTAVSGNRAVTQATDIAFNVVGLGYSRNDELLADRLSVKYTRKSGYDPNGMVTFFQKLKAKGDKAPLVFLSSHPPVNQRIEKVKQEISTPTTQ